MELTRKHFLTGIGAGAGLAALRPSIARAQRRPTVIKFGIALPSGHPTVKDLVAVAGNIKDATNGEVKLEVFANSALGNDTHMLSNVRSGAIQMMAIGDNILAILVPSAAISNVGFAFKSAEDAFAAVDGAAGDVVRADISKRGLQPMTAVWDEGFREITTSTKPIRTPEDLRGFKIRLPDSPISVSLFKDLGAAPTTMNGDEVYTSLQTHVVDGQENPLSVIESFRWYQVEKYCSLTNHMWNGYWMVMNGDFWNRLPADHKTAIAAAFDSGAAKQRVSNEALNNSLQEKLTAQGLVFNTPDRSPFKEMLKKNGFYSYWREQFGSRLWAALEKYTGALG